MRVDKKEPLIMLSILPILTSIIILLSTRFFYFVNGDGDSRLEYILIFGIFISIPVFIFSVFKSKSVKVIERFPCARLISILIVSVAFFEYVSLGVPLLGDVIYVEFGYPLLHHISVTSWLLVYTYKYFNSKFIRFFLFLFAFANPVLMINRDLLLLTVFCILLNALRFGRLSSKFIIFLGAASLFIFGMVGDLRSPGAIQNLTLPFSFDVTFLPDFIIWIFVYITSSSFNVYNNIYNFGSNLYVTEINVFPEFYLWVQFFGSEFGFLFFYLFIFAILFVVRKLDMKNGLWVALYTYFLYQAYMTMFARKFFTTNSIFIVMCFLLITMFDNFKKNKSSL